MSATTPLRIAVIGSGPSGFYAIEYLLKQHPGVEIDLYDRLPTPFGLVRGGVAPDHQKIKSVTKVYERLAAHPGLRFLGNVEIGKHLSAEELRPHYHAIIYAVKHPRWGSANPSVAFIKEGPYAVPILTPGSAKS